MMKCTLDEKRDAKTLWLHDFCWGKEEDSVVVLFDGLFVFWKQM